jgi:hypothetical protein
VDAGTVSSAGGRDRRENGHVPRRAVAVVLVLLLTACSTACSTSSNRKTAAEAPPGSPATRGDLSEEQLRDLLLTSADLAGTSARREFAGVDLTTQPTPQLALCRDQVAQAPHQLASVIAKPDKPGDVQTFELVSAFATTAGATQAFDTALADARRCSSYQADGVTFTVEDLGGVNVAPPARAVQYRLMTADVLGRDTRTLVQSGRFFVLISGFGIPPAGQTLLAYQARLAAKVIARLT